MFAVARYASDEGQSYKNNFIISDRELLWSYGAGWAFGFLGTTKLVSPTLGVRLVHILPSIIISTLKILQLMRFMKFQ